MKTGCAQPSMLSQMGGGESKARREAEGQHANSWIYTSFGTLERKTVGSESSYIERTLKI